MIAPFRVLNLRYINPATSTNAPVAITCIIIP
jgi:hypothetical protein